MRAAQHGVSESTWGEGIHSEEGVATENKSLIADSMID